MLFLLPRVLVSAIAMKNEEKAMVILGMGTNIPDRLAHLRNALRAIQKIPRLWVKQVSPVYISDALLPDNAPKEWNTPHLNVALRCETDLNPYELLFLIKETEKKLGRTPEKKWGPRVIDIDLLAFDDIVQYDSKLHIPHEHLHERPFALWPLADVAPHWLYPLSGPLQGKTAEELAKQWGPRHNHKAPLHIQQITQRIDTPQIMGIVNITPDSFSTDGFLGDPSRAMNHIDHLITSGADIIDLGAEATGPFASAIDPDLEWLRLEPILHALLAKRSAMIIPPKISIDTRHPAVAKKALSLGVDWINDVSGLDNEAMRHVVADYDCDVVFMHHLGIPVDKTKIVPTHQNVVTHVLHAAEERLNALEKAGIARNRLIFDVGIGYGKNAEQSLELIKNIAIFHDLGVRLLVGHSRKSFLTQFTHHVAHERDVETSIISHFLAGKAVDFLRVHNVETHARTFKVAAALATV